jgi:uncharacterized membrane protein
MSTVGNVCEKLLYVDPITKVAVKQPKKKFTTLDGAIAEAKRINQKENQIHKVIAYKCSVCHKYHVGKGKKILEKV